MTSKERRKNRKSKNAAIKRKEETARRVKELMDKGDIAGAIRLKERSKRNRKVIP